MNKCLNKSLGGIVRLSFPRKRSGSSESRQISSHNSVGHFPSTLCLFFFFFFFHVFEIEISDIGKGIFSSATSQVEIYRQDTVVDSNIWLHVYTAAGVSVTCYKLDIWPLTSFCPSLSSFDPSRCSLPSLLALIIHRSFSRSFWTLSWLLATVI